MIPNPNNPQPGDVFLNVDGRRLTIIARHGGWCWALDGGDDPTTYNVATIASYYKPAPPTPPDRWGVMISDHQVFTFPTKEDAVINRNTRDTGLIVHYVGTIVEE